MSWSAIYIANGLEDQLKVLLEKVCEQDEDLADLSFVVFRRQLKERKEGRVRLVERKLFPGYLLVKGEIDERRYKKLVTLMQAGKFLRDESLPARIDERELAVLGLLSQGQAGEIGVSSYYKEKDKIVVVSGPLVGLEGAIVSVNERKQRAKVKLTFMGELRVVELGVELMVKS